MPTAQQWRDAQDFDAVLRAASEKRLAHVVRPILVHGRSDGQECQCGCGSRNATVVEEIEHLSVLIDRFTGEKRVRGSLANVTAFDEACKEAKQYYCPIRCYAEQLPIILDHKHKIIGVFGGNRSGKSTTLVEWMWDQILIFGSMGSQFWWVSPTREKTRIGVRKFVEGDRSDRYIRPVIPRDLIVSFPKDERAGDQSIKLVFGPTLHLKYAGRDGGNLKGDPAQAIALDEGTSVRHIENWAIMIGRTIDTGGQVATATTPMPNHWLKSEVFDRGKSYEDATDDDDVISVELSCYRNPWVSKDEVDRAKRALADEDRIAREIDGKWTVGGARLWNNFDPDEHLREGPWRDVEGWGLTNITPYAARKFFRGTNSDLKIVGGMDFNIWPMSLVICQIACPPGMDQSDPNNWILFALDEVVKRGKIHEFAEFLATKAGALRRLRANEFAGMAIACDATAAQPNPPQSHGITAKSSHLVKELGHSGFDARPCNRSESGHPINPAVLDRVTLAHKLMRDKIVCPDGKVYRRMMVHASRCKNLLIALEDQRCDNTGKPLKVSNTYSDRISGPTDALTYLAWAIFSPITYRREVQVQW